MICWKKSIGIERNRKISKSEVNKTLTFWSARVSWAWDPYLAYVLCLSNQEIHVLWSTHSTDTLFSTRNFKGNFRAFDNLALNDPSLRANMLRVLMLFQNEGRVQIHVLLLRCYFALINQFDTFTRLSITS